MEFWEDTLSKGVELWIQEYTFRKLFHSGCSNTPNIRVNVTKNIVSAEIL